MFEVEPNLWLQALATPWLTALMLGVSKLGHEWFYVVVIVALGFGARLRPTLGVLLAVLLAGIATDAAKLGFELPRPSDVDARVLDDLQERRALVEDGGAQHFFELPRAEARMALRAKDTPDYGFVSGHVSAATAMCFALLWFFRVRRTALVALLCAWPLLMVLSRMYLGRHFLADVLGGLAVGAAAAGVAAWLVPPRASPARLWGLMATSLLSCTAAPFTTLLVGTSIGRLAGLALVLVVLEGRGLPDDGGTAWQRIARIGCAFACYWLVDGFAERVGQLAGWTPSSAAWIPVAAFATAAVFLGAVAMGYALRLYRPVRECPA